MSRKKQIAVAWTWVAALSVVSLAAAAPNDFRMDRLGNPVAGATGYDPRANGNFRALTRELASALTASTLAPPLSLGVDGFAFATELSLVTLSQNAQFLLPTESGSPSALSMPGIHVRKGLPFSFELGGRAAWLGKSGMGTATLELKWAFIEGVSYLPVIATRVWVTQLFNARDLSLATGGVELDVGKRFRFADLFAFTPYAGYAVGWVNASSGLVDFNRSRSAADSERTPDAGFVDTASFAPVHGGDNAYNRFFAGGQLGFGMFQLGVEVAVLSSGSFEETPAGAAKETRELPAAFAFNSSLGIAF